MLSPIDYSRFEIALSSPQSLVELLIVLACVGVAWLLDRRLEARSRAAARSSHRRLHGGVARVVFSITAIALLLAARFAYRRAGGQPFFIDLAMPLLIALAGIRIILFAMRRLFAEQAWLKTSERAIGFSIWGLVILYFVGVLPEIVNELDDIVLPIGRSSVSLLTIAKGFVAIVVTLAVALYLSGLVELRVLGATSLDTNTKAVLAKFIRAILLIVGVLVALQAIGFDLTLLTVFGGALGVGIGLGLQKLAANYIAGFTILLDKSIRLGDLITVDGRYGIVARVTSRYVVVRSLDGVEAIVPNETLVITTVLNHSSTTRDFRIGIPVQVAYDADLERALAILQDAARTEPRVMQDAPKAPTAFLVGFGDSGINLELGLWLRDPENGQLALKSSINRRIFAEFLAAGIEIPYPRRDVRLIGEP
ncbi:MAG: mechanosensitive ion channel domain-containing protein, partial [Betaproteobacteria bacterium]